MKNVLRTIRLKSNVIRIKQSVLCWVQTKSSNNKDGKNRFIIEIVWKIEKSEFNDVHGLLSSSDSEPTIWFRTAKRVLISLRSSTQDV